MNGDMIINLIAVTVNSSGFEHSNLNWASIMN